MAFERSGNSIKHKRTGTLHFSAKVDRNFVVEDGC